MLTTYIIASTIIFGWLTLIWSSKNWPNMIFKFIFFVLFGTGVVQALIQFGFIIKA
jgi:hypothetical protein